MNPQTPFLNQNSLTFLPTPSNPNFFHPQYHLPSSTPRPDLSTTLSTLEELIQLSETTLSSISTLLPTTSATTSDHLCTCPFNTHHRVPSDSLFRHSLRCPSSPATIDLSLLESLQYPHTLKSSHELATQNRFIQTLPDDARTTELCFSLDEYGDLASNFFYRDCPGAVTSVDQDATNRTLTLPGVLSAHCANFSGTTNTSDARVLSVDNFRILPSEIWLLRLEIEAWNNYPTSYSYTALRMLLYLHSAKVFDLDRWLISLSPRYGIVIDAFMKNHILILFKLCLKAITEEAIVSADSLIKQERPELNLNAMSFSCPILAQALMWLGTQLSVLYGEANGRLFAVEMLKRSLSNDSLNNVVFSNSEFQRNSETLGLDEVDLKLGEPIDSREKDNDMIFVSQVAAAVAALHERSFLEGKINAIRSLHQLPRFQRMAEHSYLSKKADEERQKRSNYKPISEHDGLLWQRSRNQETNKMKSKEELLAEERDYKRRRMSYRGKKMKRSTTQVMRDIIEEFMEEIKQASGTSGVVTGAEESTQMVASKPFHLPDSSTDEKHPVSSNCTKSKIFEEESHEDERRHSRDSRRQNLHLKDQFANKNREYYSRSPDRWGNDDYSSEQRVNRGLQDDAKMSRRYTSERSHRRPHEQSSHRKDRVNEDVEDRDRKRSRKNSHRSDSVSQHKFEDRYNPS